MKFLPLFDIRLEHDYYRTGLCPDFQLTPSAASEPVLRNHHIVFRPRAHGGRAYIEVEQRSPTADAIVPLLSDTALLFHLRLRNPQFPLFTVLDERLERTVFDAALAQRRLRAAPYYDNGTLIPGQGGELDLRVRTAHHRETLTVVNPQPDEHFVLTDQPRAGLQSDDFKLVPDSFHVMHYAEAARRVTVDTRAAEKDALLEVSYPVVPTLEHGVFAEIELTGLHAVVPDRNPIRFTVSFQAPELRWVYYFVTNKTGEIGNGIPVIVDKNTPPRFEFDRWQLHPAGGDHDPAEVVSDTIADQLAAQYPEHRRFRFLSRQAFPCRQAAAKKLELSFSTLDHPLATNLANPSFRNVSEIVIKRGPDPPQPDKLKSIFHVIEH